MLQTCDANMFGSAAVAMEKAVEAFLKSNDNRKEEDGIEIEFEIETKYQKMKDNTSLLHVDKWILEGKQLNLNWGKIK